jgi:hypothetical protein
MAWLRYSLRGMWEDCTKLRIACVPSNQDSSWPLPKFMSRALLLLQPAQWCHLILCRTQIYTYIHTCAWGLHFTGFVWLWITVSSEHVIYVKEARVLVVTFWKVVMWKSMKETELRCEADHSPPTCAEQQMLCCCPSYIFMAWCFAKHWGNVTSVLLYTGMVLQSDCLMY